MKLKNILILSGAVIILGVIVWQAVIFSSVPDPEENDLNTAAAVLSCGLLVFREGLEAILVISAIFLFSAIYKAFM